MNCAVSAQNDKRFEFFALWIYVQRSGALFTNEITSKNIPSWLRNRSDDPAAAAAAAMKASLWGRGMELRQFLDLEILDLLLKQRQRQMLRSKFIKKRNKLVAEPCLTVHVDA